MKYQNMSGRRACFNLSDKKSFWIDPLKFSEDIPNDKISAEIRNAVRAGVLREVIKEEKNSSVAVSGVQKDKNKSKGGASVNG